MNNLVGRVVLVTGASRGLGRSVALAFAREGTRVAVAARSASQLDTLVEEIQALGGEALAIPTDVTDPQQVAACVAQTKSELGPIDILVSNAGANIRKPVVEMVLDEWDAVMNTNLRPAFLLARAVVPDMVARGDGQVFIVSSIVGERGGPKKEPGSTAYRTAKAGLIRFSQQLGGEVMEHGVRVTAVLPGTLDTSWFDDRPEVDRSAMLVPEEVARVIVDVAKLDRRTLVPEVTVVPIQEEGWP